MKRTLRRNPSYRPIEDDDVRYAWAAYKKGALGDMGEVFAGDDLNAEDFKRHFEQAIVNTCEGAWTLFAPGKTGNIPVGIVMAGWAPGGTYMIVVGMCWFPWSTARNKLEAMVGFLSGIRREIPLIFYAKREHKRMYEVVMAHGVLHRVGTSFVAVPGEQMAVFETRAMQ